MGTLILWNIVPSLFRNRIPRTTVINVLSKLQKENYLSTNQRHETTQYWIESPKTIRYGLENKIKIADNLNELLTALYHTEHHFPFAETYDTKSSIKKFIEKSLIKIKKRCYHLHH